MRFCSVVAAFVGVLSMAGCSANAKLQPGEKGPIVSAGPPPVIVRMGVERSYPGEVIRTWQREKLADGRDRWHVSFAKGNGPERSATLDENGNVAQPDAGSPTGGVR